MRIKKQAVDLTDLALGVIVLGIVVTIGANIMINFRDNRLTDLSTVTTNNETITGNNATSQSLTNTWFKSVSTVYNATSGAVIGSGNYTTSVDSVTGVGKVLMVGPTYHNVSLNVTYQSYNTSEAQWSLPDSTATGLAEYGNWFDIIVIVGVAAVILALIFLAFGKDRGSSGAVNY